jgi:hypothetical protein
MSEPDDPRDISKRQEQIFKVKLDMCHYCGEYKSPYQHSACEHSNNVYEQVDWELVAYPNNCFCKEGCIFGHQFNADFDIIYGLRRDGEDWGYVCYECAEKIRNNNEERNKK